MQIHQSKNSDLIEIAHCHISAFRNSFSSKLGHKYVCKMLEWYIMEPKAILMHIVEPNTSEVKGYMALTINDTEVTGSTTGMVLFTKNQLIRSLIVRPWLWLHWENLSRFRFIIRKIGIRLRLITPRPRRPQNFKPSLGLVIIGVSKDHQGKGIGALLLGEMEKQAKQNDLNRLSLSVRKDNSKAIRSYQKNGWRISKESEFAFEMEKEV
jgi:GNAT superfamily N-acetyltransferase